MGTDDADDAPELVSAIELLDEDEVGAARDAEGHGRCARRHAICEDFLTMTAVHE